MLKNINNIKINIKILKDINNKKKYIKKYINNILNICRL